MAKKETEVNESKRVKVHLPRIPGGSKNRQVMLVGHNFKNYRVRRGVDVMVPRGVAMRIEQAERAKEEADRSALEMAQN